MKTIKRTVTLWAVYDWTFGGFVRSTFSKRRDAEAEKGPRERVVKLVGTVVVPNRMSPPLGE